MHDALDYHATAPLSAIGRGGDNWGLEEATGFPGGGGAPPDPPSDPSGQRAAAEPEVPGADAAGAGLPGYPGWPAGVGPTTGWE
eukprot:8352159-Pyramimonas_sp.AAC.1